MRLKGLSRQSVFRSSGRFMIVVAAKDVHVPTPHLSLPSSISNSQDRSIFRMTDAPPQADFFLHLDLAENQTQPDGESFIDFSTPQNGNLDQQTDGTAAILDATTSDITNEHRTEKIPEHWAGDAKNDETAQLDTPTQTFEGLLDAQAVMDSNAVHWENTQTYGSLMDMELNKPVSDDSAGYITPGLIFPSSDVIESASDTPNEQDTDTTTEEEPKPTSEKDRAKSSEITSTVSAAISASSSSGETQAKPATKQPAPVTKDVRRSQRSKRMSSIAIMSEEYLASQAAALPSPSVPAERVTRSKKVYCFCQKPDDGQVMIQCDNCRQWFHGACVNITDEEATIMDLKNEKYFCDRCTETMK
ncbi:hypothetical protein BGZ94_003308, partial [Podila epigama]